MPGEAPLQCTRAFQQEVGAPLGDGRLRLSISLAVGPRGRNTSRTTGVAFHGALPILKFKSPPSRLPCLLSTPLNVPQLNPIPKKSAKGETATRKFLDLLIAPLHKSVLLCLFSPNPKTNRPTVRPNTKASECLLLSSNAACTLAVAT